MPIQCLTYDNLYGFIECYIHVFKSLYGILPDYYVTNQIDEATKQGFYDKMGEELTNINSIMLVAIENHKIKGITWGRIVDSSSWLAFMGVEPSSRGKGIGRALLNRFIDKSREKGAKKIRLNTHPDLIAAISLYENTGFIREGPIVNPHGLELILYSKEIS
jgi:ribosomal protein S18 acetylase RimI-like enzyme